jgi:hypothetical protein
MFVEAMGQAIFVSHQWLSAKHPDPKGLQFRVLQDALRRQGRDSGKFGCSLKWYGGIEP